MGERRQARRYEVYLPLQVSLSRRRPAEYHTAQLRDISRTESTSTRTLPSSPAQAWN